MEQPKQQKLAPNGGESKAASSKPLGDLVKRLEEKLEVLHSQYENQLEGLRSELGSIRQPPGDDTDRGGTGTAQEQYKEVKEKISKGLAKEQKDQLDSLMTEMDQNYQQQVTQMHEKHVDGVESQVKAMKETLEEIYNSQLELVRSELDQSHQVALTELRETLDKEHKEEMNRLEQEWDRKLEDLKQDYDRELRESTLENTVVVQTIESVLPSGKEDSQEFISQLNKKLTEEHKKIIKKIEEDLEDSSSRGQSLRKRHRTHDTQTDSEVDDLESIRSAPVTQEEFDHLEEREKVLGKAEDVRKTLETQYEDIVALRTQMLNEYEQLLSVRTEVMSSQTEEVEKLQQEMAVIQRQYEDQMTSFQAKVETQTEAALRSKLSEEHAKEVEELKHFYESKVSQMEEQLHSLQHEPGAQPSPSEKERDYVRKTTMLTAISDTEETPPPSPPRESDMHAIKIKSLEDKLRDRDKLIDELKKRLETETASAEDLHGQLLDSNNKLCEFEDSLKSRGEELEELKAALIEKDGKIHTLENEKAELEEKGEKEIEEKILSELKVKISKLEEELSISKAAEDRIRQELNQLNTQHQEAIIALKIEMENINKNKITELESEFKIQLEEKLDKQAKEIANKYINDLEKLRTSESELTEKLASVESSYEKQVTELKQNYEDKIRDSSVTSTVTEVAVTTSAEPEATESKSISKTVEREAGSPISPKKSFIDGVFEKFDKDTVESSIRTEILKDYENSIDKLKGEYEDKISELNTKLQSYETQGAQQEAVIDSESVRSKVESSIREKLKVELAKEYKEKLQNVTDDYERKLKQLREQIDSNASVSELGVSSTELKPSVSESDVKSPTETTSGKIPKEYEGYVSTIRKDYEDKIMVLQTEIAQYKSSPVPSPMSPKLKESDLQSVEKAVKVTPDAGQDIDPLTLKLRQEIRENISAEYETQFKKLKADHEKQLEELNKKLESVAKETPEKSDAETRILGEVTAEYDKKLTNLEKECESKISELKLKLEKAVGEKSTAEQKVKADMFVWHEELVTQLKRKHEDNITQINKEYEEKMDLLREELQEEFDAERDKMLREHKQEIIDYEDRYENLLEGLRTGDAPDVAAIVQEKFDMELEMAKTLIQQECEETIESEQSRLSEQHEYEIEKLLAEKDEALDKQSQKFNKDMTDLRNTLLQQYEAQILENETRHKEAMEKAKQEFEALVEEAKQEAKEDKELETKSTDRKEEVKEEPEKTVHEDQEPDSAETELVEQLKQELAEKEKEYNNKITELKAIHEEEISQLMRELEEKDEEHEEKVKQLEERHAAEVVEYQAKMEKLHQDISKVVPDEKTEDTEALEVAHQQELQDLEDRLTDKHWKEIGNLETQFKSRLDDMADKHGLEVERLRNELLQAQQALDQYPDIQEEVMSPVQAVPTFHAADSTLGSTRDGSQEDFMVPTQTTSLESQPGTKSTSLKETEAFEAQSLVEDKTVSLQGTLDDTGLQSLDTEQTPRGSLRGVDDTIESTELIHFSEEEEEGSEKSEEVESKTDRSTPTELIQTLAYGTVITGGPTVKSLDDTSGSSVRASDREDQITRIKELEIEVEDLRKKLQYEVSKQDVQLDRLDREKQEESNLVSMLQVDIERLNTDREALQNTNEHLLGLLSDAVKTYMNIDDNISKKLKALMDRPIDKSADGSGDRSGGSGRPGSAEGRRTPTSTRRSPQGTPLDRYSPAREEGADGDNAQNTSVVSNVTDEGLDLSQRISDSIFQGPDLASEEEELLQDSGSRLQSSVAKLLEMIEETTSQLLDTKQTQVELMATVDSRGHDLDQLTSRCNDLEERLKEEVERKDFLALELHKAEGLIEGYSSERDQQDRKIVELEEQKENLVLELETVRNKLMDMDSTQEENVLLKKEMHDQQELLSSSVGEEAQALMLEVTRLHSENREKEQHMKQVQDRYESRVRELETSGEDMEGHYFKLLDEKKQEAADLRMQVDALEKQLKAKKQFIEEQANEREQEHDDYQKEVEKWKKIVQDIEKQNGYDKRLQTEIDDLNEQLQSRIDLLNEAQQAADKFQNEVRDKDLSITELKAIIQQLEAEIQDKTTEAETSKQKLEQLEQELSRRPYPDDEISEGSRSDLEGDKKTESLDYLGSLNGQRSDRVGTQISVEDELRLAADKTKEDVVREKHALQVQVNDLLKQISGLRNQLDEMRHRTDFSDPSEATKRLQAEREKSEEKDKEISELKLQVESLGEQVENREQQIQQLAEENDVERQEQRVGEVETQLQALKAENKQLRERVQLAGQTSSVTDISGLSQNLLEEKNQEIDHLSEQVMRLTTEFQELKTEKGVELVYDELESLKEELKQKERDLEDLQSVKVSQAFTDHSITPESSLMNVGASFSEKASIQQELEESEAQRLQRVASLEAELQTLKTTLVAKEEEIVTLQEQVENTKLVPGQDDASLLREIIDEKEQLIIQLTEQTESLQVEMENLSDFQTKLQEDFDTVQVMLEDKEREIEQLTKELTDRSPTAGDEHAVVIKHEVEISRLKKQLREKDNVVEEKMEELAELSDKLETYEIDIQRLKDVESEKEGEVLQLKKQLDSAAPLTENEKDTIIREKEEQIDKLKEQVETIIGRPPSPPLTEDEKTILIQEQKVKIEDLKQSLESVLGCPPSPSLSESENVLLVKEQKKEIAKLKDNLSSLLGRPLDPSVSEETISELVEQQKEQIISLREQVEASSLGRPPTPPFSEDEKMAIIKQQKLELETMRRQVDAALQIKPPSPPRSEDDKSEIIFQQEQEISSLKKQVEAALQISPPPPPMSEDEKDRFIESKQEEIVILKRELDQLGEAISTGGEEALLKEKVQEVVKLQRELSEMKVEQRTVEKQLEMKDNILKEKESENEELTEDIESLKEELQSVKEVKSYEDEMELKEKEDEIEQLQAELDSYRSREGSSVGQDQTELGESQDSKQLVRSMSFYKEQYEEKCSEARQLQVSLDLAKENLEKIKKEQSADLSDEIELLKVEIEREKKKEVGALEEIKETLEKEMEDKDQEIKDLKRELTLVKERQDREFESKFKDLELEVEKAKDEAAKERKDSVETLKDMEEYRERKEKERKDSLKTIQQLERDLDEKSDTEKKLSKQIKQLTEELSQYRGEDPKSPEAFEMGKDVETLQKQVEAFKKQADRTKEAMADKQKYQSQVIQLEVKYENLQKQMRQGVSDLEGHMKTLASQPDQSVWDQLKITQDRLDKTTQQLSETADKLSETEGKLSKINAELASREEEVKEVQQDLWKTSGLLSITSGKLQETEEKLRQSVAQVMEREEQIHQLQGELQESEKVVRATSAGSPRQTQEVDKLRQQLSTRQEELEQVKHSLQEAVEMNEQQLQMTEQKDQEFVKLKLEIQQTIADKDKTIKEQKQKLKGIEHKEQDFTSKERQMEKMKHESQQALATKDRQIGKLREDAAQLQRQLNELRLTPDGAGDSTDTKSQVQGLESELKKLQSAMKEKEKEIERLHQRYDQTRRQETETVGALQNQLSQLQQELQAARTALKASDPRSKGQGQPGEGQGEESAMREGISDEAESHIQQLRRELLIAKTALMQIQRGEGFDRERSPVEEEAQALVQEVMSRPQEVRQHETLPGQQPSRARMRFEQLPDLQYVPQLQAELQRTREELELYRNSSSLSARDFVQKVMDLKDELSSEHQRHIDDISSRASQDAETQLAQMRIKYEDEIEQLKQLHGKEVDQKLRDQLNTLERKHKSEMNKLVLRYQEQIELLKTRAGPDIDTTGLELVDRLQDEVSSTERLDRRRLGERQDGVGQDQNLVNGQAQQSDGISSKLQNLLRRLHNEGVQVLTISELQYLNRNLSSQELPRDADIESLKAGWENERQSYLSTIQSLKDLLAQTHKLRGLDKDDDEQDEVDDWLSSIEGSDWRAELLRAIGYVFSKEREALLAELRSHVLSHPDASLDEIQRLEQKIRNQEAHHHSAMDQIFSADRQSMLAEIRDLRAHATISRMHHQEERERLNEKLANAEDHGTKKERQLKRQDSDDDDDNDDDNETSSSSDCKVQLLEFKIQQEKVLQDDLRTSLDAERARSGTLSGQLNHEKSSNLDLQSNVSALQVQVGKLKDTLEREQSRFVSVTNALEEEKSKSLNLSELLESERQTLYRVQSELETLRQSQESLPSIRHLEELQAELNNERDRRCQAESQHEVDRVTMGNLQQEVEMEKRHQQAIHKEYEAKTAQFQRLIDNEKQKVSDLNSALDRELNLTRTLRRSLEAEKSQQEATDRERKRMEDLQIQLETERGKVHDLNNALQREHRRIEEAMSSAEAEKRLLQEHLDQERDVNHHLKHDLDSLQIEKLEALSKFDKEHDHLERLKAEKDQMNEELKNLRTLELQRDQDREAERLSDKKAVRQADREKEEYRMKLHEQELETQRLTQKCLSLEEQVTELQENELKAVRELEQEKLRNLQFEEEAKQKETEPPSPEPEGGEDVARVVQEEQRERWHVYRSQLESMCQSLHYLVLRCREQLSKSSHSAGSQSDVADFDALHSSLRDLLNEVKQLQEIEGDFMSHPSGSVNERILRHNEELTNFVARSSEEKNELRNTLSRLEEEIWRYRQKDSRYQEIQRASTRADESLLTERANWAKERLSLQMSLNTAEREIDQLQTDLRIERERRVAAGITDTKETDKVKIQRLYGKYLRAESFRKALIYQKKYLLLLLGGFQDTEETTLALLARMGATSAIESLHHRHYRLPPITMFRSAVRVVIAVTRMQYLVRKWKRATRVGSEVVGGTVDQINGYMPEPGSFSPPRHPSSPRIMLSSLHLTSPPRLSLHQSPSRSSDHLTASSRSQLEVDTFLPSSYSSLRGVPGQVHTTPPTKDYSSTTRYTSPSSGARRKILTTPQTQLTRPGRVRFTQQETANGDLGSHDDYINRLENLQTRLGALQSGCSELLTSPTLQHNVVIEDGMVKVLITKENSLLGNSPGDSILLSVLCSLPSAISHMTDM